MSQLKYNMYLHTEICLFNLIILRFCVGDRFYLCDNKILCEYDYEERLVFAGFANIAHNPSTLQHIRRQFSNVQVKIKTEIEKDLLIFDLLYILLHKKDFQNRKDKNSIA